MMDWLMEELDLAAEQWDTLPTTHRPTVNAPYWGDA